MAVTCNPFRTFLKTEATISLLRFSSRRDSVNIGDNQLEWDPDNRRAFDWSKINSEDNSLIRALGCLRKNSAILKKGKTIPLKTKGKVLAFKRIYQNQMLTVVVNYTEQSFYLKGQGKLLFGNGFATKKSLVTLPKALRFFLKPVISM